MRTSDFDFELPDELIAHYPLEDRAASRMLVIDRQRGTISHRKFSDLIQYVQFGDRFVFNNTRVVPARFFSNDGRTELLRLDQGDPLHWKCLVRPGKRMKVGRTIAIGESTGTVVEIDEQGNRLIKWDKEVDPTAHGKLALPPYMEREQEDADSERYQTVYAKVDGAVAAPTAGLHFTPELVSTIPHSFLTLHVGPGTFRPVQADDPRDHEMHSESYYLSAPSALEINNAERVISVGTTVTRVLEHLGRGGQPLEEAKGSTDIFIYPPYEFQVVDALLTNFHLPKSTLLMLVSALAGKDLVLEAYRQAVAERYRFYSYGDCMLIV